MTPLSFTILSSCILAFIPLTLSEVVWNKPSDWNEDLPASIEVFQTNSSFVPGVNMTAAYSRIDLSDPDLELKVVHSEVNLKTPLEYIQEEPNLVYVAMNGGYFNMTSNYSISVVISNSSVIAGGLPSIDEKFKDKATPYYPTRGAFGVHEDGTPELAWTYDIDHDSKVFAYPDPAPNCFDCAPKFVPSKSYPANGDKWNVTQAVGAGPMIMRGGKVNVTSEEELFYRPGKDVRNPRTGICVTKDKEVIFTVVDGRYELSGGLLIVELGNLMSTLGCTDALNLDGGGSTAMIVNGFVTNRPSDATGMRHVTSALLVVSKTKPNPHYKGHDWHKKSQNNEEQRSSFRIPKEFEDILHF